MSNVSDNKVQTGTASEQASARRALASSYLRLTNPGEKVEGGRQLSYAE
ncbi:MAG TPA: hypothetical protein VHJ19_13650 [Gammaproteobacteria bacterium]|nr:hypothetical protein [Pseudomonadota bacterium]HEX2239336.1 hypothetical protein [Gammaproteobacteria bacterium]